jgi:ABC-2 type transport system ATP-binding protein
LIGAIAGAVRDGARVVRILRGSVKAVSLADFVRAQLPADVQVEALAEVPAVPAPDAAREETSAYVLVPREGDDLSSMLRHFLDWRGGWLIGPETARFHARSPLFLMSVPKSGTAWNCWATRKAAACMLPSRPGRGVSPAPAEVERGACGRKARVPHGLNPSEKRGRHRRWSSGRRSAGSNYFPRLAAESIAALHNRSMSPPSADRAAAAAIDSSHDGSTTRPALRVRGLRKAYGAMIALQDLSFAILPGEIVGLLGPNGAGKTTTINMILGVLEPSAGSVQIGDFDLGRRRAQALERTNFAAVYAALPGNLTVRENLMFFGLLYGITALRRRVDEMLDTFDLVRLRDTKCGLLSSGEQTRAALAKALLNRPQLLLLDEPTASLDPSAAQLIRARIKALADQENCGILWTSHNMYEVEAVCNRVLFLSHGQMLLEGDPRTLPEAHGSSTLEELFIRVARERLTEPRPAEVP